MPGASLFGQPGLSWQSEFRESSLGSIGTGLTLCGLNVNTEERKLGCEVHIPDNEKLFDYLEKEKKVEIEGELGPLEWNKQPGIRRTRIGVSKELEIIGSSEFGKDDEAFRWLLNTAENFQRVFSTYLSGYDPIAGDGTE